MEWIEPGLPWLWFSGTHRGAETVFKEVISPTGEKIQEFRIKIKKFYPVGDHVITIGTCRGLGKSTGAILNAATAHVWTFRNGKAVRFEAFHDVTSWQEVMGHTQPQRMAA